YLQRSRHSRRDVRNAAQERSGRATALCGDRRYCRRRQNVRANCRRDLQMTEAVMKIASGKRSRTGYTSPFVKAGLRGILFASLMFIACLTTADAQSPDIDAA